MDEPVQVLRDPEAVARAAAEVFMAKAVQAQQAHGLFTVALTGGHTPRALYETLAVPAYRHRVNWRRVSFFFGDERAVPPDHPDSNYRLAYDALLGVLNLEAGQVHRMKGEVGDLEAAARMYEDELRAVVHEALPAFDLLLLGMGPDGHIASLFPHSPLLQEQTRWVVPVLNAPKPPPRRLTLTVPVLNAARSVLFLITGTEKAAALREVWQGPASPEHVPAKLIRPGPQRLLWIVDEAAAGGLQAGA